MKCQHCDIEMIFIYGVSMVDPCATEFRGATGKKYGTPLDLMYCPKCGTVKAIKHQTEEKDI